MNTTVGHHFNNGRCTIRDVQVEVISFVYLHVPPNCTEGYDIRRTVEKKWMSLQNKILEFRPRVNFGRKQKVDLQNFVPERHPKVSIWCV